MIRKHLLLNKTTEKFLALFAQNLHSIKNATPEILAEFLLTFEALCEEVLQKQASGEKGAINHICISYLYHKTDQGDCGYRLDAYDHKWLFDECECTQIWPAQTIYRYWQNDMEPIKNHLRSQHPSAIYPYEWRWLFSQYAKMYHLITKEICQEMMVATLENQAYKKMAKTDDLAIHFGEYFDQLDKIYDRTMDHPLDQAEHL